jgi:hypothetical protein
MQETPQTPPAEDKGLGAIWRLAQIVLVLAASYLYFQLGSFGGLLQRDRLFGNAHTWPLVQAVLVGAAIGLCLGLALKDLSKGRIVFVIDWPTILINVIAAGVFIAVAVSLNVAALKNVAALHGPIKDAIVLSPLLPFIWVGLTLTTIVRSRSA